MLVGWFVRTNCFNAKPPCTHVGMRACTVTQIMRAVCVCVCHHACSWLPHKRVCLCHGLFVPVTLPVLRLLSAWLLEDARCIRWWSSHCRAMQRLQKAMESKEAMTYFGRCQRSLGHALPLSSLLLKPVQRILRYKLLLEVSCTPTRSGRVCPRVHVRRTPYCRKVC